MKLRERLADGTEELIRHRRRTQARKVLFGDPLIGGIVGVLSWGLAQIVSYFPPTYGLIATIVAVVVVLALTGLGNRRLEEPVGDLANRGMTRVYGMPWIPFQFRQRLSWDWEPWRTAFMVTFLYLALDAILSATLELPMLLDLSIVMGLVLGSGVAIAKDLSSRDTWRNLLEG